MTIVFVPGFTQTATSWREVLDALPRALDTITIDTVPIRDSFEASATAIADHAGDGVYAGYSMGGRLCLRIALDRPELVRALVLVSASPGIASGTERRERVDADAALAQRVEQDGVDAFLDAWLAQPMFATVPSDAAGLADRHRLSAGYLAACLRVLGTGAMEPLWDRLPELRIPVLLVTGREDAKFDAIAQDMWTRLSTSVEHVRLDCGHAVPLEQPAALARAIGDFVRAPH